MTISRLLIAMAPVIALLRGFREFVWDAISGTWDLILIPFEPVGRLLRPIFRFARQRVAEFATYDPQPLEVTWGLLTAGWGWRLLGPAQTFASTPSYRAMAQVGSEETWGLFMFLLGLLALVSVVLDYQRARWVSMLLVSTVWFFIAAMFWLSNQAGTGWLAYGLASATAGLVALRLGVRE